MLSSLAGGQLCTVLGVRNMVLVVGHCWVDGECCWVGVVRGECCWMGVVRGECC